MGSRDSWPRWRPLPTRSCSSSTTCTSSGRARASRSSPHSPTHVLDESTLVLAGRTLPRLPIGRLRAAGRLFEVGVAELALDHREVGLVTRSVGLALEQAEVVELAVRTEGWAAGTYLAALTLKDDLRAGAVRPTGGGDDRFHVDYFDYEHLSRLRASDVRFLTRTAVLDRMCGPLCDAMLESSGSAARLESLARSNLFVVRLDAQRSWYRYHRGFRDFLRAELGQREPEVVEELHGRAAAWCESNGEPEAGVAHARAAGDVERLARLVTRLVLPLCSAGRVDTVESWLAWFDEALRLEQHPTVGVLGAWVHSLRGRPAAAKRWLAAVDRGTVNGILPDGSRTLEPWLSVVRAAMCGNGVERMRSDAEIAVRDLGASSAWRPMALLMLGVAQLLLDDSGADETLADAAEAATSAGAMDVRMLALVERSLLAASRANDAEAESLVAQARTVLDDAPMCRHPLSALVYAASARHALRHGDLAQARADRTKAAGFAPLGHALPWYSVQTSLELARVDLALLDPPAARTWISAAGEILSRRPLLGALGAQADGLGDEASRVAALCDDQPTTLSAAELRLLPLLTTHLSFREIGERLGVTRSTVKTQAISMYRKLGVSSRSEAIERAVELGLVDGASELRAGEFIPSG